MGSGAVNEKKDEVEGPWSYDKITLGTILDVQRFIATMPREKINKAVFLLADPEFE